jgi:dTDP-glucose 4,6-dehydratase
VSSRFEHLLVTGGCGFIGSNFVRRVLAENADLHVTNLDLLTYSGNLENLAEIAAAHGADGDSRYRFVQADIGDGDRVSELLHPSLRGEAVPAIDAVVHFAAESHVDRSILGPTPFVSTNVVGTSTLIETCRRLRGNLPGHFRFVHVSTDEVYGSLEPSDPPFTETTPLAPNSPYAASKAGSDLLVRSYCETFNFPAIITRCSNNYGPYQFPEKLIPLMLTRAMRNASLPLYGDGLNVRDWIHVYDHCAAVWAVLNDGELGSCYNIGGESEMSNLQIVQHILQLMGKHESLINYVEDRLGHDRRYAMDNARIRRDIGWSPIIDFADGIQTTIDWYRENPQWWRPLLAESERVAEELYKA